MAAITLSYNAAVEADLRHHHKLDELAHALASGCHRLAVTRREDKAVAGHE